MKDSTNGTEKGLLEERQRLNETSGRSDWYETGQAQGVKAKMSSMKMECEWTKPDENRARIVVSRPAGSRKGVSRNSPYNIKLYHHVTPYSHSEHPSG